MDEQTQIQPPSNQFYIIALEILDLLLSDLYWPQLKNPPNLASQMTSPSNRRPYLHLSPTPLKNSCSSQLGLIIVTIGINQPYLAFLHICTHAFFKAILFTCARSTIHSLNDEQDIQKTGLFKAVPFTTTALIIEVSH
eukprot:bmy_05938T0